MYVAATPEQASVYILRVASTRILLLQVLHLQLLRHQLMCPTHIRHQLIQLPMAHRTKCHLAALPTEHHLKPRHLLPLMVDHLHRDDLLTRNHTDGSMSKEVTHLNLISHVRVEDLLLLLIMER